MPQVGRWYSIRCYKHNGTLHRIWDRGLVVENDADHIVVATRKAKVVEANGRCWFTKEPAVTIFSKKEWWNVICMLKKEGVSYYCNIASPSIVDRGSIKYIDYDLDAKLFHNDEIKVLDEKEYNHHKKNYLYSDELDVVLRRQTQTIVERMKERAFPFQDDLITRYFNRYLDSKKKES